MTPSEFKAWFDGFTEAFDGRIPTKAQWARIKDRVAEIDGKPVTQTVYLDRYIRPYPYWNYLGHGVCGNTPIFTTAGLSAGASASQQYASAISFNSSQAMADLGRAEAASLSQHAA